MNSPASPSTCAETYTAESARIQKEFEASGDGLWATAERARLVDALLLRLYRDLVSPEPEGPKDFCLAALGGYGRGELFPYSDVDLLFLGAGSRAVSACREAAANLSRSLWDLGLRVGQSLRTLAECGELQRQNLEFNVSLLDSRYLAGDRWVFTQLHDKVIPHLVARDRQDLVSNLVEMTSNRHEKQGRTIYHLEPNVKEAPGGLRDYHVAHWLTLLAQLERDGRWEAPQSSWPAGLREGAVQAANFLATARCFLHLRHGRDDNQLTYGFQDEAAALGIGLEYGRPVPAAQWMRNYFRHARAVRSLALRLMDEITPARSSLYTLFQDWRSRLSNADFSVVKGRLYPRQPDVVDNPNLVLGLFEMMARHGLEPSREAERWVEESLACFKNDGTERAGLWGQLRQILVLPSAAEALRAMHRLGLLLALFPEFKAIDCLVVRDYYHRYTVDEHSLTAIQNLHALRPPRRAGQSGSAQDLPGWGKKYGEILGELEQPELLFLCLLIHDIGKGMPAAMMMSMRRK